MVFRLSIWMAMDGVISLLRHPETTFLSTAISVQVEKLHPHHFAAPVILRGGNSGSFAHSRSRWWRKARHYQQLLRRLANVLYHFPKHKLTRCIVIWTGSAVVRSCVQEGLGCSGCRRWWITRFSRTAWCGSGAVDFGSRKISAHRVKSGLPTPLAISGAALLDAGAGATAGDLNGDGKPDFVLRHWFGSVFSIITNTQPWEQYPLNRLHLARFERDFFVLADFNEDGKLDIAWRQGFNNDDVRIRLNTNTGE